MAEIPDGGSSGGGSTTSICTVNPSDNVSIINNLISRISDIEKFLSQLVGADVHADNLSELADNIGNILNGTITLPNDGNSPYGQGGSIPVPDDFSGTVISGNVITTWENGVVSFQVIPGAGVTVGGGGATKWAQVNILATANAITSISELVDASNIVSVSGSTIIIAEAGLYLFAMSDALTISHTAAAYGMLTLTDNSFSLPGQATVCQAGQVISGSTSGSKFARLGTSSVTSIPSAGFVLTAAAVASAGTWNHIGTVSVLKLS